MAIEIKDMTKIIRQAARDGVSIIAVQSWHNKDRGIPVEKAELVEGPNKEVVLLITTKRPPKTMELLQRAEVIIGKIEQRDTETLKWLSEARELLKGDDDNATQVPAGLPSSGN